MFQLNDSFFSKFNMWGHLREHQVFKKRNETATLFIFIFFELQVIELGYEF